MTKKGKKIADVGEPSSSKSRVKHKKTKTVKATEEGETSSKTDTRLKTKTRPLKTAKRIITTEEQAERIRVQRRRNFNKNKDVTCKRRGDVKSELEGAPTKFPSLNTRTTPSSLFDELPKLNDAQRQAIQDIGFGSVLSLQVKKLPCRLAYWILEHFDENRCELELEGGIRVKITEDDVYRVYGFPKGSEIIPDFNRCSNTELCEEWVAFFGLANREKIKIGHVLSEMLDCTTGGTWFKRHFMIAMTHSLIQSCTSGTVYPHILRCLENVRTLKKWNWGEYVLRSLVDHKLSWVGDEDKVFSGPTLFLVLFYVDRCELHRKRVEREFPIIKNWTSAALRKRQATEENIRKFGTGSWREPIVLPAEYVDNEQPDGDSNDKDDRLGSRIMKMAVSISAQLEDLRDLIYSASVVDKESSYFLQCVDAAIKITGVKVDMDGPRPWRRPEGMEIDDDPLSYSDELRASVDAACANVQNEKVRERVSTEGIPSFDLDMGTQDEVPIEKDPVEHVPNKEGATMVEDSFAKESAVFEATIYKEQSKEYGMVDDSVAHEAGNGELIEERVQQEPLKESAMVEDSAAHETGTVVLGKSVDGIEQPSKEATEEGFMGKGAMDAVQSKGGCVVKKVVARKADIGKVNEVAKTPPRRSTRVGGAARGKGSDNIDKQLEVNGTEILDGKAARLPLGRIDENIPMQARNIGKTPMKSLLRKTAKFRSPFLQREISTSKQLTIKEKELAFYTLYAVEEDRHELMFSAIDVDLRRYDMITLKKGIVVGTAVIDAWAVILNGQEQYRSETSPTRFFATTSIYVDCLKPTDWSYADQKTSFFLTLYAEIQAHHGDLLSVVDMFFFPVYEKEKYYALCFDTRRQRLYILDNTNEVTGDANDTKYRGVCRDLRKLLADFLYYHNDERKAKAVANSVEHVVKMSWADSKNEVDTGVYLMRHLETFMGDVTKGWTCNLSNKRPQQLTRLRIRYCASIVAWEGNSEKKEIGDKASYTFTEMCKNPGFNVNSILLG